MPVKLMLNLSLKVDFYPLVRSNNENEDNSFREVAYTVFDSFKGLVREIMLIRKQNPN